MQAGERAQRERHRERARATALLIQVREAHAVTTAKWAYTSAPPR